jgi:hypothetical protein
MITFIDHPDDLETQLEEKIRRVRRKNRSVFEVPTRQIADAARWGHPR